MKGVNKFTGVGNIGEDPEIRYTQGGDAVCNFSLATSESWKNKSSGAREERTEWHRCVAFKQLAEIIQKYGKKGQRVYVEGKLRTRKWQSQSGEDHYTTQIHLDEFIIMHDPNYTPQSSNTQNPPPPENPRYNENGTLRSPYAQQPPPSHGSGGFDAEDDDIPF